MGDTTREEERRRRSASAGKAPATDSDPEAKVAESRKPSMMVSGDPPNIEEQDPPLDATDSDDADGDDDDDEFDGGDAYSVESVTVRSSIWEHEWEGGRRVCSSMPFAESVKEHVAE